MYSFGGFRNIRNLYTAVFAANILAFISDSTLTWSSPVLPKLNQTGGENPFGDPITDNQAAWIGSFNTMGAIFGPLPCMLASDKFGRKTILLLMAIPHAVSFLMLAFSSNIVAYYIARFLGGFALGSTYTVLPIYVGEISEDSNRGMFGTSINVFAAFGDVVSYSVGPYVTLMWFNVILFIFPVAYFVLFFTFAPESPYYLVAKDKMERSKQALSNVRNTSGKEQEEELRGIKKSVDNDMQGHFMDIFRSRYLIKALIISVSLLAFQQLSGIFAVMYYTQPIFEVSGASIAPEISSILVGIVLFLATLVTPLVVDRLGRKILLLISAVGMSVAEAALATYFVLLDKEHMDMSHLSWVPILSLVVYIFSHNVGFGILPLTVMSEIFPSNVKSIAASITSVVGYTVGFLVTNFFNDISNVIGMGGAFYVFTGFNIIAIIFVLLVVPETKGKSFDEIQNILKGVHQ